jgi:competence protein ComEA
MNRIHLLAFVVAVGLAVVICLYFMFSIASTAGSSQSIELEQRINPNVAPLESLMRLPGVGRAKAQSIVTYREKFSQTGKADLAFKDCNDLKNVEGIGPKVAVDLCPYLKFNGD